METNAKMGVKLKHMKKPRHAVSTCSPDCPTDSAVERALVDLEWRREAAGKRNGNTHRINTEVPKTENAIVQRGCTDCSQWGHVFSWKEMMLEMNGEQVPIPELYGSLLALEGLAHTQAWQEHSLRCSLDITWAQTPGLYSRHEASMSRYGNMQHEGHQESQSTVYIPSGTAVEWTVYSAHRMPHQYVMHMQPCTKNKSREGHHVIWTEIEWNHEKGAQQMKFSVPHNFCSTVPWISQMSMNLLFNC